MVPDIGQETVHKIWELLFHQLRGRMGNLCLSSTGMYVLLTSESQAFWSVCVLNINLSIKKKSTVKKSGRGMQVCVFAELKASLWCSLLGQVSGDGVAGIPRALAGKDLAARSHPMPWPGAAGNGGSRGLAWGAGQGQPGRWAGTVRPITALRTMTLSLHQFSIFKKVVEVSSYWKLSSCW